jgi:predicted Fe-S protein YdhL (DUF1289 family)
MIQMQFFDVPSPCIGICQSDSRGYCIGCYRTRDERQGWITFSSDTKQRIIKRAIQRKKRIDGRYRSHEPYFDNEFRDTKTIPLFNTSQNKYDWKNYFSHLKEALDEKDVQRFSEFNLTPEDRSFAIKKAKTIYEDLDQITENEVTTALSGGLMSSLSSKALQVLVYIFDKLALPVIVTLFLIPAVQNNLLSLIELLNDSKDKTEIKNKLKTIDTFLLAGSYRVVTRNNLNIREKGNKKSKIIGSLEIGNVVEVLDGTNRSWLKVKITTNGIETIGWVYRRYTLHLK